MHRTQVLFEDRQYEALKTRSRRENKSLSNLVRGAVDIFLGGTPARPKSRLMEICGIVSDPNLAREHHDDILYGPRTK